MKTKEEILNEHLSPEFLCDNSVEGGAWLTEPIYEAMQAYHEAKMKEITDVDIEEYASAIVSPESKKDFERGEWYGLKYGAIAMRDGEIKHIEK